MFCSICYIKFEIEKSELAESWQLTMHTSPENWPLSHSKPEGALLTGNT